MKLRQYQHKIVDAVFEKWRTHTSTLVVAATGCGKCLGVDTPILMFDGTIRAVQDVRIGDLIMGPDSLSREVLSTCAGVGDLFLVTPTKGDSFVCNGPHLLSLKMTPRRSNDKSAIIVHIEAERFNKQDRSFRHRAKTYRSAVDWPLDQCLPIDPYFLGLWLGDGTSRRPEITTQDLEVKEYLKQLAHAHKLRYVEKAQKNNRSSMCALSGPLTGRSKNKANPVLEGLQWYGLLQNKHVPQAYKSNGRYVRLDVLAGLLDSDGHCPKGGGYDFISKSSRISQDVAFLARSLGYAAYIKPSRKICRNNGVAGDYWRVSISGNVSEIPVKIHRKRAAKRRQKKNVLVTGTKVEPFGVGNYYGFEITGDRRFLLGDFTVTHNTVVFAEIIKRNQPGRSLVLAHRTELITQAADKIQTVAGLPSEIEKAELYASTSLFHRTPVVVSSIQTQCSGPRDNRRYKRFRPEDFSLLVCDEAHHAAANTWKEVIAYYRQNPNLRVLGVTATPDRADKEALGQVFESVAYTYDILDAIEDGYLVDITQQFVPVAGLDYSHIKTTAGDLNEGELAKVMELEANIQGICQPTLEVMFGLAPKSLGVIPVAQWRDYLIGLNKVPRRTIVFTVSVLQAEMCCNVLSRAMAGVEWVCGATNKEKRADTLKRFSIGETHCVVNCAVLTEGFDNPGVEVIVQARPTKSRSLYAQMVGRSTRPLPGLVDDLQTPEGRRGAIASSSKPYCRIMDFVGNSGKHKLVTCVDILGGNVSPDAAQYAAAKAMKDGKPVRILRTMSNAEAELEKRKREEAERQRQAEAARRAHLLARVDYRMQDVNPFNRNQVMRNGKTALKRSGKQFTDKQARFIRRFCGKDPNQIPYGYGTRLIAEKVAEWDKQKASVA